MGNNDLQERNAFLEEVESFIGQGDDETALALAELRLKRMPDDLDARVAICRVRIGQGRLEDAQGALRVIEGTLAGFFQLYACLGDLYLQEGMRESARTFYRKFIALTPDSPMSREIAEKLGTIEALREEAAEEEAEDAGQVPSDFQTVTLAELYIRQGHLRPAAEVLEAIIRRDPGQEKAAAMLREVWEMIFREESGQRYAGAIAELSRWLDNIDRLRGNAA